MRNIPLIGGMLGGVGDVVSGVGNMATGNFSTGLSQIGSGIKRTANIIGRDVAATVVGLVGTVYTTARDIANVATFGNIYSNGNMFHALKNLAWNAVVPDYGFFGGPTWGITQGRGPGFILNQGDLASYHHDRNMNEIEWIKRNFTTSPDATPVGPVGAAYALIGSVPFAVKGLIDGESY